MDSDDVCVWICFLHGKTNRQKQIKGELLNKDINKRKEKNKEKEKAIVHTHTEKYNKTLDRFTEKPTNVIRKGHRKTVVIDKR